jgi:hypothetical protein
MSEKKVLCPDSDCNTENEAGADSCSKCGLDLPSFFTLSRVLDIRDKNKAKADADAKAKDDANKPKPRGGLSGLVRRK